MAEKGNGNNGKKDGNRKDGMRIGRDRPKITARKAREAAREADTEPESGEEVIVRKEKRPGSKGLASSGDSAKKRRRSAQVRIEDEGGGEEKSRHQSIETALYMVIRGPQLDRARAKFQTMMFARDGFYLKTHTPHREVNFLLILEAARAVYPAGEFKTYGRVIQGQQWQVSHVQRSLL